jgi:type II secretory pathway component GspD/PulD (secretin)
VKHPAGFLLFASLALSGCGLTGLPRADQAGRIADQQLEARDAELDKLAERNSKLRKEADEAVMDVPAKAGSGVVGEIDLSKAFTGKDRRQIVSKGKADAVKLEFTDASLKDIIIVFMQDYLKQPYTFQPSFKDAQVNLFFDAKATREDLIKLFDTLLENYGVRLRYSGGVYLIGSVEDKTSVIQQPSPLGIGDAVGVFRANYLDAREFLALARQVVKYPEKLSVITGNVIIVNSTSIDVRAVHALLQDIDQPSFSGKHILVYSPRYLSAASMIALLDNTQNQLLGTQNISRQFDAKHNRR